ncbi:aminotransferase class IV [Wukongibacter sp. M2B1]|uniref:aminotransferase class IV n=1 Tax=Wukongibacter sp. M2B1 TaxID=3088895 RepID=UPI003D7B28D1
MIKEWELRYLIHNGKVHSVEEIDMENKPKKISVYEVIRIIDGIPLYLEEHIERLRRSCELLDVKINKTDKELVNEIMKLIEINEGYNLNIKILCSGIEEKIDDIYLYYIKSYYPPRSIYEEGIHTILYKSERENPNAKTYNKQLRERINEELKKRNAFEALLVNSNGGITEGSRSNVFFVRNNTLFTSPPSEVLLGVTRTKIIELCRANEIAIIEKEVLSQDLKEYDGAFITGTSTNVLPINTIGDIKINSCQNDLIIRVMKIYEKDKDNYIKQKS